MGYSVIVLRGIFIRFIFYAPYQINYKYESSAKKIMALGGTFLATILDAATISGLLRPLYPSL